MTAVKHIFCRTEYNYDMNEASDQSGLRCEDPTLTQQQFKDECDINVIVERFNLTGEVPQLRKEDMPSYADYEGIFDFQTAMNQVRAAEEDFMTLPAKIRARFDNQPQKFLEFCHDDANYDEAERMGILDPELVNQRRLAKQKTLDEEAEKLSRAAAKAVADAEAAKSAAPKEGVKPPTN